MDGMCLLCGSSGLVHIAREVTREIEDLLGIILNKSGVDLNHISICHSCHTKVQDWKQFKQKCQNFYEQFVTQTKIDLMTAPQQYENANGNKSLVQDTNENGEEANGIHRGIFCQNGTNHDMNKTIDNIASKMNFPVGTIMLQSTPSSTLYILPDGTTYEYPNNQKISNSVSTVTNLNLAVTSTVQTITLPKVSSQTHNQPTSGLKPDETSLPNIVSSSIPCVMPRTLVVKEPPPGVPQKRKRGRPRKQKPKDQPLMLPSRAISHFSESDLRSMSHSQTPYFIQINQSIPKLQPSQSTTVNKVINPVTGKCAIPKIKTNTVEAPLPLLFPKATSGGTSFICPKCFIGFLTEKDLVEHSRSHPDLVSCPSCRLPFLSKENLISHHRQAHPYNICNYKDCDYFTGSKANLKQHLLIHQEARYQCPECNMVFKKPAYLRQHKMIRHSKEARMMYKCSLCEKSFKQKMSLKYHMGFHIDGLKKCTLCSKEFHYDDSLQRHMNAFHGNIYFNCQECGKRFGDKHTCNSHWKRHFKHKFKIFKCPKPGCNFSDYYQYRIKDHILRVHDKILPLRGSKLKGRSMCHMCGSLVTSIAQHLKNGSCHQAEKLGNQVFEDNSDEQMAEDNRTQGTPGFHDNGQRQGVSLASEATRRQHLQDEHRLLLQEMKKFNDKLPWQQEVEGLDGSDKEDLHLKGKQVSVEELEKTICRLRDRIKKQGNQEKANTDDYESIMECDLTDVQSEEVVIMMENTPDGSTGVEVIEDVLEHVLIPEKQSLQYSSSLHDLVSETGQHTLPERNDIEIEDSSLEQLVSSDPEPIGSIIVKRCGNYATAYVHNKDPASHIVENVVVSLQYE